jgi:hypothetical protein
MTYAPLMTYCLFNEDLSQAVDPEVIKIRTNMPSEATADARRINLLQRDTCCVWSGAHGAGLFPISGVPKYVLQPCAGKISDRLLQ